MASAPGAATSTCAPVRRALAATSCTSSTRSAGPRLLRPLAAREGEVGGDHPLHLLDILVQGGQVLLGLGVARQHGQRQPHAGQRRAQVVADAGQHLGPLADEAADAFLHAVEGLRRLADLAGALRLDRPDIAAEAEGLRRRRPAGGSPAPGSS